MSNDKRWQMFDLNNMDLHWCTNVQMQAGMLDTFFAFDLCT